METFFFLDPGPYRQGRLRRIHIIGGLLFQKDKRGHHQIVGLRRELNTECQSRLVVIQLLRYARTSNYSLVLHFFFICLFGS